MKYWRVRATVERIIDGDTFVATLDLGWGLIKKEAPGSPCRIRLLNYNTPERGESGYIVGKLALAKVLPLGIEVWLTSHKLDGFGRALCDIHLDDGKNILELLPQKWRIS